MPPTQDLQQLIISHIAVTLSLHKKKQNPSAAAAFLLSPNKQESLPAFCDLGSISLLLQRLVTLRPPNLHLRLRDTKWVQMAGQTAREWLGSQQFPAATQTKLMELLGKLKEENVSTLTILVMGKGGMGKSSTVNSILGERVAAVSAFQSEGLRPIMCSRTRAGFTLNIIDTPGIVEGGYVNEQALGVIKRFLLNKTIDVLLYVDRLDAYRMDTLDRQVVKAITDTFGKRIWGRSLVVLTHAQLSPPDGLNYDDFVTRRSEALLKYVRLGGGITKREIQKNSIPVVLVENSGRCKTNDSGEKILPNDIAWIPNLVETIINVVTCGGQSIIVDKKLIEGPNPNSRGKLFIPLILAFQYLFVVKTIQSAIKDDVGKERTPLWELRDMGMADREF